MNTILKTLFFESGMTQEQFANKLGIPVNTLRSQLKKKETLDLSKKYAKILGVNYLTGYQNGDFVKISIN